jgi:hypothetical protein
MANWDDPDLQSQAEEEGLDRLLEMAAAAGPPFDEDGWKARGEALGKRYEELLEESPGKLNQCQWDLGDWLVEGLSHYGEYSEVIRGYRTPDVYTEAEQITGLSRYTLKDLCSTARRFPRSVRTDACNWSLHRKLRNALPKADENTLRAWLQRAADEKMSGDKLVKEIRSPKGSPTKEKTFRVTVPLSVWETLKDFADNENSPVGAIARRWLVNEANLADTQMNRTMARQDTEERRRKRRQQVGRMVARAYDPLGLRRD